MRVSKLLIGGILLCLTGCIDPFRPDIRETQNLLVVNGIVSDTPGMHYVEITRSSPYNQPAYIPVPGCVVRVENDQGGGVTYEEIGKGWYGANLEPPFLGLSRSYRLLVFTPEGKEYQSDYEPLLPCPRLDSLYFEIEHQETDDPLRSYYGIRFLVDVKPEAGATRNVLWKLVETYEYHSTWVIQYIWDGKELTEFRPPIDSLYTCFKTGSIRQLFAASTRDLVRNELDHYPLNYVSNQTGRLLYKYSLLVSQYSLSDDAFTYWETVKKQTNETGGLYETQPAVARGNIYNPDDPGELVLGYFFASQIRERRILVENHFDFPIPHYTCIPDTANSTAELGNNFYYMVSLDPLTAVGPPYIYGHLYCFDCTMFGGTTTRPDYWDQDE